MAFQDLYYYPQEIKLIHGSVTVPTLPKPPGAVEEIYHILPSPFSPNSFSSDKALTSQPLTV